MKLIIDDKEIRELPLPTIDQDGKIVIPPSLGRKPEKKNVDALTKQLINFDANSGMSQTALAKATGLSQPEISTIERGIDRTNIDGRKEHTELALQGKQIKHKIIDRATARLMDTLDLFDPNNLDHKDMPGAAVKLASVVEKMNNDGAGAQSPVQFILYAPRMSKLEDIDVIDLKEN